MRRRQYFLAKPTLSAAGLPVSLTASVRLANSGTIDRIQFEVMKQVGAADLEQVWGRGAAPQVAD